MGDVVVIGVGKLGIDGHVTENPTAVEIGVESEEQTLPNKGTPGGGNYAKFSRISKVSISATIHNATGRNVALLVSGETANKAAATAQTANINVGAGLLVPIDDQIEITGSVSLASNASTWAANAENAAGAWLYAGSHFYYTEDGGTGAATEPTWSVDGSNTADGAVTWVDKGAVTFVEDTDYVVWSTGVQFPAASSLPNGAPVTLTFVRHGHEKVEIATSSGLTSVVNFDGINEETSEPMSALLRKVVWDPASIPLMSDGYNSYTLVGEAVIDTSVPTGRSGFGTLRLGDSSII